jgi:hypothetical protein
VVRITDANAFFAGSEIKFTEEISKVDMVRALNWYSQNKDSKDALKYSCDYFKKNFKIDVTEILKNQSATFGFVCRIVSNGGILSASNQKWFDTQIENIKASSKNTKNVIVVVEDNVKTSVVNIQERIREKASECIAELEGQIDELVDTSFKSNVSPYSVFHTMNIKDAQTKYIVEWAKEKRNVFVDVSNTKDSFVKEAYSNFTKVQLKKLISYYDQVILDCQKIAGDSAKTRKPRKIKAKTPEQLVAKLNYLESFDEMNIKSIAPSSIIGVMQLWIYNTKTRKLGVYHADDAGGLSVKGSTIVNFSEIKSVQKKLRKPEVMIPQVLSGGKVFLRNVIENIRAVESVLNGRINKDILLLKVVK